MALDEQVDFLVLLPYLSLVLRGVLTLDHRAHHASVRIGVFSR